MVDISKLGCLQVLTAIELARNARIAANRAFFSSLSAGGSGPAGVRGDGKPFPSPLPVDHPVVLAAARKLAQRAALEEARQQVCILVQISICKHLKAFQL